VMMFFLHFLVRDLTSPGSTWLFNAWVGTVMRTDQTDAFLLPSSPAQSYSPLHPVPTTPTSPPLVMSPIMGSMPMPANAMTPDEMLRAYAERKKSVSGHGYHMTQITGLPMMTTEIPGSPMSSSQQQHGVGMMSQNTRGSVRSLTGQGFGNKANSVAGDSGSIGGAGSPYGRMV